MQYFGGGYPGLYFPTNFVLPPPFQPSEVSVELPMVLVTGVTTGRVLLQTAPTIAMAIVLVVEIPLTRGLSVRVEVPLGVSTAARLAPTAIGAVVPMRLTTRRLDVPVTLASPVAVPMTCAPTFQIPTTDGVAPIELPLCVTTRVTLERD